MKTILRLLLFIPPFLVFLAGVELSRADDILEQKKELEKIQSEISESRKIFESLKSKEQTLVKDISDYEQRASMDKTVLNRLKSQLNNLHNDLDFARTDLDSKEGNYKAQNARYLGNLKIYYISARTDELAFAGEIKQEKNILNRIIYLKALAGFDRSQLSSASKYLSEAESQFIELVDEEKNVGKLHRKKRSEYSILNSQKERREKDLRSVKRKKQDEADRLVSLSESAKQMEELISRLQREKVERDRNLAIDLETGNFAGYKGKLGAPLKGRIVSGFGKKIDKKTYLKSFSPGIEIKGKANSYVMVIADGIVVYTGNIRGYGNFMIIEHEDGYYSTYAGLDELMAVKEEIVTKGHMIGKTKTGKIKFELRKGRDPLDPVKWINLNAFK